MFKNAIEEKLIANGQRPTANGYWLLASLDMRLKKIKQLNELFNKTASLKYV